MMDSNEIKLVTRQETFNDLAVRELAKGRAACICRIQFGRCKRSQCSSCIVHKRYTSCLDQMSDYDKLRLDTYTTEEYNALSAIPERWRTNKSYVLHYVGFVAVLILFIIMFILPFAIISGPFDRPVKQRKSYTKEIIYVMKYNQNKPRDLNKDGLVNCIDYTLNFKLNWDKCFPDIKDECQIIRNRNFITGMNHLFIKVGDTFVEPWAWNPNYFRMEDNWDSTYNPKYNIYGETEHWLKEVK